MTALDHLSQQLMKDDAGESAVADLHVAASPILLWQPDFETDARLRSGRRVTDYATERRQVREHRAERSRERARPLRRRAVDQDVLHLKCLELLAGTGRIVLRMRSMANLS